jgi:hypothetical protein
MNEKNNKQKISLMLLREALWQLEDKIKVITETQADHEADLIRLKHSFTNILNHLKELQSLIKSKRRLGK